MDCQKTCLSWNLYEFIRALVQNLKHSGSGVHAGL